MTNTVVTAHGLTKSFAAPSGRLDVLRGVDLTLTAGELVALVGTSGSGKSTLLHILGTLSRFDSGSVTVAGTDLASMDNKQAAALRREHIGFVFQSAGLLPQLTAAQNVALAFAGGVRAGQTVAQVLLERVGLSHRANHRPSELSGGEQQRVALARALVNQPCVVLADEPTGNLDEATSAQVLELLTDIASAGTAVLIVTHDPDIASVAHRTLRMQAGQLCSEVTTR